MLLSVVFSTQGQVLVGTGTDTAQRLPFDAYYGYSYTQSIYLASELNATGTITSLQWYYTGTGTMPNSQSLVVYIGHTTKTAFSSGTDWEPVTNLTQVYTGGITTDSSPGWKTITLTTPFVYNGTSNLIVAIDENLANYDLSSDRFWNTAVSGNRSIAYISDSTNPDPLTPPTAGFGFPTTFIPNTVFGGITQACPTPLFVTSSNITTTSATLTWQAPVTPPTGGSDYYISTSNVDPTIATIPTGSVTSGNTFNATALTPATTYYVWVRNNCGSGVYSSWSGVATFVTACVPVVVFNENFNGVIAPSLPTCWSKILRGPSISQYAYAQTDQYTVISTGNSVQLSNSNSSNATDDIILVSPSVSSLSLGTYRLKFLAKTGYGTGSLQVGTLDTFTNAAIFTPLDQTITISNTVAEYVVEFNTYTGTNTHIGIRMNTSDTYNSIYLDNILWELSPSCPDVTTVTVPSVTTNSATVEWNAGGSETAWQYVYGGLTVTDPSALTPVNVTTTPSTIVTGLSPLTSYKVWVRSNCGVGGFGAWIGPIVFTTACLPATLPWSENFDSLTTGNNIFPSCWAYNNILSNWSITNYPTAYSGANSLRRSWSTDGWAFTPTVTLTAGTSYTLSYYMRTADEVTPAYEISVSVGSGQSAGEMADVLLTNSNYHSVVWTKFSAEYTPTVTGVYAYGLHVSAPIDPNGINFDDFYLSVTPNCLEPTQLLASNVTDVAATVSWTEAATIPANGYEYYLSTSSTSPTAATVATGSVAAGILTKNFIGLTANTPYYVWVRSVCSSTASSVWSSVATFTTNCTPVTTFSENFDASTNMPSCWNKVGSLGTAYIDQYSTNPPSSTNVLYIVGYSSTSLPVVAMPAISNSGAGTHRLKFKMRAAYSPGGVIEVGYLTDRNDASSFVSLQTFTASSSTTYEDFVANFGVDTSISQHLAFRHTANPTNSVNIDNVSWDVIPSTAPPCATAITATPNATCGNFATQIAWTAATGADGYLLKMGTTAGGTDVLNNESIGSLTTYSFVGNMNTTYYYTITPFNSFGNAIGCTEQSFITNINGCYCTSLPTSNDGSGITNVVLGTTSFTNGDVTYSDKTATPVSLEQNANINLQVTFATGYTYNTYVFIDLNNNYTFEESEQLFSGDSPNTNPIVYDASFLMPVTAALGSHRMRLVTYDYNPTPLVGDPCYSSSYGVTIDFTANVTTGLSANSFDNGNFAYYPNPVKDVLNLSYTNEITNVAVYNLLGQLVISKSLNSNQSKIDMSKLTKGTYLVKVTADNQVKTLKIIKE
jgi:multidrug transporter EmrE-like cation transporter